jgi:BirA family biotin operon repressor/biotin-[acetyl-CoA-carboxylase] ligase
MFDPLPDDLADALTRAAYGADLHFASEIGSTNDAALALAHTGAAEGTAVLAEVQTAGRGRRGRTWFSPPGSGIYLSIVVRFDAVATLSLVTLAVGVAAADAVRQASGLPLELKWPNDLVVGRMWRKIGGILCESTVAPGGSIVVVGIGINRGTGAFPPELSDTATSIETELGRPIDRAPLVAAILVEVQRRMNELRAGGDRAVLDAWRTLAQGGFGGRVRWQDHGRDRVGIARDVAPDGALLVDADGTVERLVAGEVLWDRRAHG